MTPQIVFITGATSGFGWASAKAFAAHGAKIIACGRRGERLQQLARELPGGMCHTLALDVRKKDAVFDAVHNLPEGFKDIDLLVNNAGLALGLEPAHEAKLEDWEAMVDTNIKGLLYCTRAVLPGMVARGRGHVINIGSTAAHYPYPGGNAYGGTKAFVDQFSLNLRADLLGKNIRVSCINPGMVETEFSVVRFHGNAEQAKKVYAGMQPLTAEDIAATIVWCATLPPHVNINNVELMPTNQAFSPFAVYREPV